MYTTHIASSTYCARSVSCRTMAGLVNAAIRVARMEFKKFTAYYSDNSRSA